MRPIVAILALLLAGVAAAQQPTEIVVRNGTIVNATGRIQADLRIRNGTIAEIGTNLTAGPGVRVIDATESWCSRAASIRTSI